MTALTVTDVLTRVQRQFGDEAGIQVTQDDVIRWINDCQREIAMQHENLFQVTALRSTTANNPSIDLPEDLLSLQEVKYKGPSDSTYFNLRYLTADEVQRFYFDLGSGTPLYYTRGEEGVVTLIPAPETAVTSGIKLVYSRYTVDVTSINDALDLPEYYHQTVLEFCLMKAYEMDENWEAADRKSQYVQSTIDFNNGRGSWLDHMTYPTVSDTESY